MSSSLPRLVHLIADDGAGGGPQSLVTQMKSLTGHYEQFFIHGATGRAAEFCEQNAIPHRRVLLDRKPLLLIGALQTFWQLLRIRPDILVVQGQWGGVAGAIAGWLAHVPRRVYVARWPAFYANWDLIRCIRNHLAEKIACALSHRIICLTESSRYQLLLRRYAPEDRFVVVPNAVAASEPPAEERIQALQKQYGFERHSCNVVSVGRLAQQKRNDWLLKSWKRVIEDCPDAHLWIVGHGPKRDEWQQIADSLGLNNYVSWIEHQDYTGAEYIAAGDIFAHSALFETFGNVILEAMISGVPIVATEVDGPRSIITNEQEGLLVPPADTAALAKALIHLVQNPDVRHKMGDAGKETAKSYHPERITPRLLDALKFTKA